MTSRSFLEGKFLKPPEEQPVKAKIKEKLPPKPISEPKGKQQQLQQPEQPEQKQQQPPQPAPYRKETPGKLLQNPPRFPSPPVKGAPRKSKVSFKLPEIKSKKKRRRKANLYDVIARMTPMSLRVEGLV
jgi:hypothetical protein